MRPGPTAGAPAADAATLRADANAWDAYVEAAPTGAYPQLSAWAEVKAPNGWRAERVVVDSPGGPVGAQVLVHGARPLPWAVGYAPRAPVAAAPDRAAIGLLTEALREAAGRARMTHLAVDPEVEAGDPLAAELRAAGWRRGPAIQADRTRLVDLTAPEEALWSDLRSKWRQYVNKARRAGVTVVDAGPAGLDDFYRIYVDTARRAGFVHRARPAYEAVYRAFDRGGRARLLNAHLADGTPVATLMLLACGRKVVEPYGGMTVAGGESRANYLLKWEAIRSSRERGHAVYDMWGLAHGGIERFKAGFGGREVRYAGTFEIVTNPLGRRVFAVGQRVRVALARRRHGVRGGIGGGAAGDAGADDA